MPDLKQILGALVFGSGCPLSVKEMRKCLSEVAEENGGGARNFAGVTEGDIRGALGELAADLERTKCGFVLMEVGGGFRLQSDSSCGIWLKNLLDIDRPNRLSRPALETLAIVAYRQPVTRAQIESVRGVAVDHVVRSLLEMQLVRIVGRSDLPGRPFLYGTTGKFLDHFGLKNLEELQQMEPMLLAKREFEKTSEEVSSEERDGDRVGDAEEEREDETNDEVVE